MGRHIVQTLLAHEHDVTLFHRGQTGVDLFSNVTHVHGDRLVDLSALDGEWDAVIDTSAYFPRAVRMAAEQLAHRAKFLLFISTISVYEDVPGITEDSPKLVLADPTTEEITGETYGGLKVLCEAEVQKAWGGRCAVIRPGIIVGPDDYTDRFTYWLAKFAEQEKVLVPQAGDTAVQWIDVRDLAELCVHLTEKQQDCIFNAIGPLDRTTFNSFVSACQAYGGAEAVPISLDEMKEKGLQPWTDFPMLNVDGHLFGISTDYAREVGLILRPLEETIHDTLHWRRQNGNPTLKVGLSAEKEAELIK